MQNFDCHDFSQPDDVKAIVDSYFEGARMMVRKSYQLYAAKHLMGQLMDSYKHPDQAVSDPKFYALKDAIAALEAEMN